MEDKRINVNGLMVYPFTSEEEVFSFLDERKSILIAINSKKIKGANEELRNLVNSNIGYVDGSGALMALHHLGASAAIKIPGCDLWLKIIKKFEKTKRFYLVGGKQEVIDETIAKLKQEYPDLNIVGYRNGYLLGNQEREMLLQDIAEKKPDVVFVAMGSPTQEYLMMDMYKMHPAIYQGLGGSFDVYVGKVRRAPQWFTNHGLEGVYRAFWEPKKRLKGVLTDILFVLNLYLGKYGKK